MKLSRNMRKRLRSLTRKQLLAYIFLDGASRIDIAETPVKEMTRKVLGNIIISWGHSGKPDAFYRQVKDAKALSVSDDELFWEFCKKHTPPVEDMVERQRTIQLALHQEQMRKGKSEKEKIPEKQ